MTFRYLITIPSDTAFVYGTNDKNVVERCRTQAGVCVIDTEEQCVLIKDEEMPITEIK